MYAKMKYINTTKQLIYETFMRHDDNAPTVQIGKSFGLYVNLAVIELQTSPFRVDARGIQRLR